MPKRRFFIWQGLFQRIQLLLKGKMTVWYFSYVLTGAAAKYSLDPFLNPLIQNEEFIFSKKGLLHLFCISYTGLSPVNCQAMNLVQNPWKN